MSADLAASLHDVRQRIGIAAARASREPAGVRLVVVTKTVAAAYIDQVVGLGVHDIGENRVQEAESKRAHVTQAVRWHLIGHLQTNKAKRAASLFDAVQSVDSERVARALSAHRDIEQDPLPVLIEVELTGLPNRSGVTAEQVEGLVRAVAGMPAIHLVGLMTVAAPAADPGAARPLFAQLRALRDRLEQSTSWSLPELSMGMSDDFDVAIEEGATIVRVGRAIFGERR